MNRTRSDATAATGRRSILRCAHLPPLTAQAAHPAAAADRRPAGPAMLRRGLAVLAALALPALAASLAETVHRARPPWATPVAGIPQASFDGTAALFRSRAPVVLTASRSRVGS